jgi:hypothetical protein
VEDRHPMPRTGDFGCVRPGRALTEGMSTMLRPVPIHESLKVDQTFHSGLELPVGPCPMGSHIKDIIRRCIEVAHYGCVRCAPFKTSSFRSDNPEMLRIPFRNLVSYLRKFVNKGAVAQGKFVQYYCKAAHSLHGFVVIGRVVKWPTKIPDWIHGQKWRLVLEAHEPFVSQELLGVVAQNFVRVSVVTGVAAGG